MIKNLIVGVALVNIAVLIIGGIYLIYENGRGLLWDY